MVTRYFDEPVPVEYRTDVGWCSVLALGVRRRDDSYAVLITCPLREVRTTTWVPRARVRPEKPAAVSGVLVP